MAQQESGSEEKFYFRPFEHTRTNRSQRLVIEPDVPMGKIVRVVSLCLFASFAIASIPLLFALQTPNSTIPSEAELWRVKTED